MSGDMTATTKPIWDPVICNDWERVAIMEVIEHWRKSKRKWNNTAIELAGRLLWLLPESRSGPPVVNPLDHSPVVRPGWSDCFSVIRHECEEYDESCEEIFERYVPAGRIDGARECIVCLGAGWLPITHYDEQSSCFCRFCGGQGVVAEVLRESPSPPAPLPTKRGERGDSVSRSREVAS